LHVINTVYVQHNFIITNSKYILYLQVQCNKYINKFFGVILILSNNWNAVGVNLSRNRESAIVVALERRSSRAEITRMVGRSLANIAALIHRQICHDYKLESQRIHRLFPINLAYGDTVWRYEPTSRSADT